MNIREKLAKELCNRGAGCKKHWDVCADKALREIYLKQADQQIAIFKEFIETMGLPDIPFGNYENKYEGDDKLLSYIAGQCRSVQQDLIKAIINKLEANDEN